MDSGIPLKRYLSVPTVGTPELGSTPAPPSPTHANIEDKSVPAPLLDAGFAALQSLILYETKTHFYISGCDRGRGLYKLLIIDRAHTAAHASYNHTAPPTNESRVPVTVTSGGPAGTSDPSKPLSQPITNTPPINNSASLASQPFVSIIPMVQNDPLIDGKPHHAVESKLPVAAPIITAPVPLTDKSEKPTVDDIKMWEEGDWYTQSEIQKKIQSLTEAARTAVEKKTALCGLMGILRCPKAYLVAIMKKDKVGEIGGRYVYSIDDIKIFPIIHKSMQRYKPAVNSRYKALVELIEWDKDFYFSYFYDLTNTLQHNLTYVGAATKPLDYKGVVSTKRTSLNHILRKHSRGISAQMDSNTATATAPTAPTGNSPSPITTSTTLSPSPTEKKSANFTFDSHSTHNTGGSSPRSANSNSNNTTSTTGDNSSTHSASYNEQFVWNIHMARQFLSVMNKSYWLVPVICGYFKQNLLRIGRHDIAVTLIARRSRHAAGTRYLKRGVNTQGYVANEVETEQIVHDRAAFVKGCGEFSSVVLLRGSIPLYWAQENPSALKPNILVFPNADPNYVASRAHFNRVFARYGSPVVVLSLIKKQEKTPKEIKLGNEFTSAIKAINLQLGLECAGQQLSYCTYDFLTHRKEKFNVLKDIKNLVQQLQEEIGIFYFATKDPALAKLQHGIIRVNCIDCLDRTNVAQFCVGKVAMRLQLKNLNIDCPDDLFPELNTVLQDMYTQHGDRIAHQYAGSGAMHKDALHDDESKDELVKKKKGGAASNAISAVKRYYSQNVTDVEKQNAINLILGNYIPTGGHNKPQLWELDIHTSNSESDSLYESYGMDIFRVPYRPELIGFHSDLCLPCLRTLLDRTTIASIPDPTLRESSKKFQKVLFTQYFRELYDSSKLTSFEKEFSRSYNKPVQVSLTSRASISSDNDHNPNLLSPTNSSTITISNANIDAIINTTGYGGGSLINTTNSATGTSGNNTNTNNTLKPENRTLTKSHSHNTISGSLFTQLNSPNNNNSNNMNNNNTLTVSNQNNSAANVSSSQTSNHLPNPTTGINVNSMIKLPHSVTAPAIPNPAGAVPGASTTVNAVSTAVAVTSSGTKVDKQKKGGMFSSFLAKTSKFLHHEEKKPVISGPLHLQGSPLLSGVEGGGGVAPPPLKLNRGRQPSVDDSALSSPIHRKRSSALVGNNPLNHPSLNSPSTRPFMLAVNVSQPTQGGPATPSTPNSRPQITSPSDSSPQTRAATLAPVSPLPSTSGTGTASSTSTDKFSYVSFPPVRNDTLPILDYVHSNSPTSTTHSLPQESSNNNNHNNSQNNTNNPNLHNNGSTNFLNTLSSITNPLYTSSSYTNTSDTNKSEYSEYVDVEKYATCIVEQSDSTSYNNNNNSSSSSSRNSIGGLNDKNNNSNVRMIPLTDKAAVYDTQQSLVHNNHSTINQNPTSSSNHTVNNNNNTGSGTLAYASISHEALTQLVLQLSGQVNLLSRQLALQSNSGNSSGNNNTST